MHRDRTLAGRFQEKTTEDISKSNVSPESIYAYPLLGSAGCLDPVPALDDVCLEADGSWTSVKLEKESTSIAEHGAHLVASP